MHGGFDSVKGRTREPNGRLQRAQKEFSPTQVRRLRDAAMVGLRDPEWGTELGRLYLTEAITAAMYAAGKRWREEAAKFRGAIDIRPVKSPAAEPGIGGTPPDPESKEGQKIARRHRDTMERFYAAHAALMASGMLAESMVRHVCEEDHATTSEAERRALCTGLAALYTHYQLTAPRKSAHVR